MAKPELIIENLVFEGGGVKGAAYAGCVDILDKLGIYASVKNVAGASAGAITASLLGVGAGARGLDASVRNTDFSSFIRDRGGVFGDLKRVASDYGMHTGHLLVEALKTQYGDFCGNPEITFGEHENLVRSEPTKYRSIYIVASNVSLQRAEVLSHKTHPALPLWKAVRASTSIPFIFEPVRIGDSYYVDGGMSWNYPIDLFDSERHAPGSARTGKGQKNPHTLGFFLEPHEHFTNEKTLTPEPVEISGLKTYLEALAGFMYESANTGHLHPDDQKRTIFIDSLNVSGANFKTPKSLIEALVKNGRSATEAFFSKSVG